MDVIAIVKLSINQQFISDDLEKELTLEQWKVQRAKKIVKAIKNQAVQVKSGFYENLMSGTIIEVKEVKQKGKILYTAPLPTGLKITKVRSGDLPIDFKEMEGHI